MIHKLHKEKHTSIVDMGKLETRSNKWFEAAFEGCTARPSAIRASTRICRAYGISGQADPAYIANVIEAELINLKGGI